MAAAPKGGGNPSPIRGALAGYLEALVAELPDATVEELTRVLMSRTPVRTSRSSVQRALVRLGYTRENDFRRPRARHPRAPAVPQAVLLDDLGCGARTPGIPRRILLQDGIASQLRLGPTRPSRSQQTAWAALGYAVARRSHPPRRAPSANDPAGSGERPVLPWFVKQRRVPWLRRGDIVVMDKLNIHKMPKVRATIEPAGAFPVYLPTYSPELNPIELWWGHLARSVRALTLDGIHALAKNLRRLRSATRLENIEGWFRFPFHHAQINRSRL